LDKAARVVVFYIDIDNNIATTRYHWTL